MVSYATAATAVLVAWVVGGLPFGLWIGKRRSGLDVRQHGSRGTGMTNVGRVVGPAAGRQVLALDLAKGVAALLLARAISGAEPDQPVILAAGLAAVLGHVWPPLARFRGGKGVATGAGVLLVISPPVLVVCLVTFAVAVLWTRVVSAGSIAAAAVLPPAMCAVRVLTGTPVAPSAAFAVALSLLVLWSHRGNAARMLDGREPRIGRDRRAGPGDEPDSGISRG